MNTRWFAIVGLVLVAGGASASAQFVRGHIFVSVVEPESCHNGREWIVEIDPETGDWGVFADSDDDLCSLSGLAFTPDGERLLAISAYNGGWVASFDANGNGIRILGESDGLGGPYGANAIAFDMDSNLYVVSAGTNEVLKFHGMEGPAVVFADRDDGIRRRGALGFHPYGDLFYASDVARGVYRITPDGRGSLFDGEIREPYALGFGREGNLFIAELDLFRYDDAERESRRVLAADFACFPGACALGLSPDGSVVYLAQIEGTIFAVDSTDGTTEILASLKDLSNFVLHPSGMAVYGPSPLGDMDADGDVDLEDFNEFHRCLTGPDDGPVAPKCYEADIDKDTDADLVDFARFQIAFTGTRNP